MNGFTCGFIGLGLIGGSIAKALKENISNVRIIAYDINEKTLQQAYEEHIADAITLKIDESFRQCNYIFLCAPVKKNDENLDMLKKVMNSECLLTDVGSVKGDIHAAIKEAELDNCFVGGHPMAGSERIGYQNSKAILLQNAYYILTPSSLVSEASVKSLQNLVEKIGAIPLRLTWEQHDYITAAISHLPHIIAASLVNLVKDSDSSEGLMKMVAAGGFKDITRIASSSADMWQQICVTNTENIATLLAEYITSLTNILKELKQKDSNALFELFDIARTYRASFIDASSGPIKRTYAITLDIADEPGALAAIATILALHQISIKNIGIVHNREYEGGMLRIEFHEEAAIEQAKKILGNKGYTIHEPG